MDRFSRFLRGGFDLGIVDTIVPLRRSLLESPFPADSGSSISPLRSSAVSGAYLMACRFPPPPGRGSELFPPSSLLPGVVFCCDAPLLARPDVVSDIAAPCSGVRTACSWLDLPRREFVRAEILPVPRLWGGRKMINNGAQTGSSAVRKYERSVSPRVRSVHGSRQSLPAVPRLVNTNNS